MVGVSFATAEPEYGRISGLAFDTATDEHRASTRSSWGRGEVLASALILLCILGGYVYFTG